MNTRKYSKIQEKRVSKTNKGKVQPNSGATMFAKGDVITDKFLIECKTRIGEQASINVKKEWLTKNEEEAFAMNKNYSAVAISFGDGNNYYIISEKLFTILRNYIEEDNNDN